MSNASTYVRQPADMAHDRGDSLGPTDAEIEEANALAHEGLAVIEARSAADRDEARFWRSNDRRWKVGLLAAAGLESHRRLTVARYYYVEASRRIERRANLGSLRIRVRRPVTRCSRPFGSRVRSASTRTTTIAAPSSDPDPEPPRPILRRAVSVGGAA